MPQRISQTHDVVIVGAGISGLSCAHHLLKAGFERLTILTSETVPSVTQNCAGYAIGGCFDNFSRVHQAHGAEHAHEFWQFGNTACDALTEFLRSKNILFHTHQRLRLLTSTHEVVEAEKAVAAMKQAGFSAQMDDPANHAGGCLSERVLGCQIDDHAALWVSIDQLLQVLKSELAPYIQVGHVNHIQSDSNQLTLAVQNHETLMTAEMIVLANHLALGPLVPNLQNALVSYADQYFHGSLEVSSSQKPAPGTFYSANHGYEWGVFNEKSVALGGARFLRPLAGFEAKTAVVQPHIQNYLQDQFAKTFDHIALTPQEHKGIGVLDCRPCDELPIIGPMYGEPRLLVATGFMGTGLTQGFLAGKCLAELIINGSSSQLPRIFWPERLRSLPESR